MSAVSVEVLMAERRTPLTRPKNANRSLTTQKTIDMGRYQLLQVDFNRWKMSWIDSRGSRHRIQLKAENDSTALRLAEEAYQNPPRKGQKHDPNLSRRSLQESVHRIRISDALLDSAKSRNWSAWHRRMDGYYCKYFLKWIDSKGLNFWDQLRFEHVEEYKSFLVESGYAFDTIRLYLTPVRRTARWLAVNWPKHYHNICEALLFTRSDLKVTEYDDNQGNPVLSIAEVLDFLDWLSRSSLYSHLAPLVALQGLAGLQLQEAFRLTWEKIDFSEGTVTIDGEVKNRYRIRKIPLANVVLWLLRTTRDVQPEGSILQEYRHYTHYSNALKRCLRFWNASASIKPKDLRNTIQSAAIDGGWYGYYVQRYVGHAPQTIGEKHYHGDRGVRMLPLFREKVVGPIEAEIAEWDAPADTRVLPGPRLRYSR